MNTVTITLSNDIPALSNPRVINSVSLPSWSVAFTSHFAWMYFYFRQAQINFDIFNVDTFFHRTFYFVGVVQLKFGFQIGHLFRYPGVLMCRYTPLVPAQL